MFYIVPIEPLEERYSTQWHRWFEDAMPDAYFLWGEALTNKIKHGAFLDVISTNHYKARQIQRICAMIQDGKIKSGDTLLFHDMWFPGLEALAYIRDGMELDIKIYGCLHAGTYDHWDFLSQKGMEKWGARLEEAWFALVDGVFVATHYHRKLVCRSRAIDPKKIHVTGFPIVPQRGCVATKKHQVVFPHRLDPEKQPEHFAQLTAYYPDNDVAFVRTKDLAKTKAEYYQLLAHSKVAVSYALQETWGIAMQEAIFAYCIPIVPARLSYAEMYAPALQYEKESQVPKMVRRALDGDGLLLRAAEQTRLRLEQCGRYAIGNMKRIMNYGD